MNPEIRHFLAAMFRRLPLFLAVFLTISAAAIALAILLPTVYQSRALLLMEAPQIPDELAASTVRTDEAEQLEVVQRRLMTRANLIEIAREMDVYAELGEMNPDTIVERMRDDTTFVTSTSRDAAVLMEIMFDARNGDISARVTNEFVTRILAENARQRMRQAEDTLAFFEQEVSRLGSALKLQSARILEFQNENADALPDTLNYRLSRQALLQERLSQIGRDRAQLGDQRDRLVQMFETTGLVDPRPDDQGAFERRQLSALRQELSSALAVYAEDSPQVRMLRARLSALEGQIAAQAVPDQGSGDGRGDIFELQLSEIDSRLAFMAEDEARINAELVMLQDSITRTPNNAITLEALQRDYENVQQQYNAATERLSAAATGERIEVLSKGQRISVIEQAVVPNAPSRPNRPLIAGGGLVSALILATALVVMLELMDKSVRRPVDLSRGLGITPLVTVPYISTSWEKLRYKLIVILVLLTLVVGVPALLVYIHYQVVPLDLLLDRLRARIVFWEVAPDS